MMLVGLIASLSATREKIKQIKALGLFSLQLVGLSAEIKRQATKKLNKINACRLIGLVAPTGYAAADKRRPPSSRWLRSSGQNVPGYVLEDTLRNPEPKTVGGRHGG
jgi:hypothetical protein